MPVPRRFSSGFDPDGRPSLPKASCFSVLFCKVSRSFAKPSDRQSLPRQTGSAHASLFERKKIRASGWQFPAILCIMHLLSSYLDTDSSFVPSCRKTKPGLLFIGLG